MEVSQQGYNSFHSVLITNKKQGNISLLLGFNNFITGFLYKGTREAL